MRTRDVRPWWWWVNPWLYIKRRDAAYDDALDSLRDLALEVTFPDRPSAYSPAADPAFVEAITQRCRNCGLWYVERYVELRTPKGAPDGQ
jgi:hypothetical protein